MLGTLLFSEFLRTNVESDHLVEDLNTSLLVFLSFSSLVRAEHHWCALRARWNQLIRDMGFTHHVGWISMSLTEVWQVAIIQPSTHWVPRRLPGKPQERTINHGNHSIEKNSWKNRHLTLTSKKIQDVFCKNIMPNISFTKLFTKLGPDNQPPLLWGDSRCYTSAKLRAFWTWKWGFSPWKMRFRLRETHHLQLRSP